jgi:CRP/FNR family transcriptional regulator
METPWFVPPSDFLGRLPARTRDTLFALGHRAVYRKNDAIFQPGSPGENVYILINGRVKICALSPAGRAVILWFCFPGEIFGLAEMARAGRREVASEACAASEVLVIPQHQFKLFLLRNSDAAMLVIDLLSCRLRGLADMLINLTSDDVTTRLVKLLVRLSARYGKLLSPAETLVDIHLTHQEIADMIGTSRQSASTAINALKRQGLLCMKKHCIHIQNGKLLENLVGDLLPGATLASGASGLSFARQI